MRLQNKLYSSAYLIFRLLKWLSVFAIAVVLLAVLVNFRDEHLSNEARLLLTNRSFKIPDNENIFVAFAGFDAPGGDDVFKIGRINIEKNRNTTNNIESTTIKSEEKIKRLHWQQPTPPFDCRLNSNKINFIKCIQSENNNLKKTLKANSILIQRYLVLQNIPYYNASYVNEDALASGGYILMGNARMLLMTQAILNIELGNIKEGFDFFKKDIALWRRVLANKKNIFDSMWAIAQITLDVQGLSFLLSTSSTKLEPEQTQEWRMLLMPLSHEQFSLYPAIKESAQNFYNSFLVAKKGVTYQKLYQTCRLIQSNSCSLWQQSLDWLKQNSWAFFLQPNATINDGVPFFHAWLKLTNLSRNDYFHQRDKILKPLFNRSKLRFNWIYNFTGKKQFYNNINYYDYYVGRLCDGDTYLRLVRLQLELRLASVPQEEITTFIKEHGDTCCAPSSDFIWNPKNNMLSFKPYGSVLPGFVPPSVYIL